MFTNIVIMMPALVLLLVIGAYFKTTVFLRGRFHRRHLVALGGQGVRRRLHPARPRLRGPGPDVGQAGPSIVIKDIAQHGVLPVAGVHPAVRRVHAPAVSYDFSARADQRSVAGRHDEQAELWSGLTLHMWWWFIPPGLVMTLIVAALYISNVGLDEVFNRS